MQLETATSIGTRDRILDAARRLFAAKGYAGVSMRDIGASVGVQQSSLYNHFPGKQAILVELMTAHLERVLSRLTEALSGIEAPTDRLAAFIRFHVTTHIAYPDDVFLAYMEIRSLEADRRARIVTLRRDYEAALRDILETGTRDGSFTVSDTGVATRAILAMLTGVTTWYRADGPLSAEALASVYGEMVLRGVGATATGG